MSKSATGKSPLAQMEEEKREHKVKMRKMEKEMEAVFETKVREKKEKLDQSEKDLIKKHELVSILLSGSFKGFDHDCA